MTIPQRTQADPLHLQQPIHTGACGETWHGVLDTQPVRVHRIHTLPGGLEGAKGARLRDELARLRSLQHRAVVPIRGLVLEDDGLRIISNRIDGVDLTHLLHAHGALKPRAVCQVLCEIAAALSAAHRLGLIHSNLTPASILLTADGDVRLQDFGIAAVLCSGLDSVQTIRLARVSYLSPERLQGRAKGGSQDVYALGMVGLACLLGGLPDPLPVAPAQRLAALKAAIEDHDFPLELTELLLVMVASRPDDRLGAAEVARHARRMIAESPGQWLEDLAPRVVPAVLGLPAPSPRPNTSLRPARMLAAVTGLVVGFGVVGTAGVLLATVLLWSGLV